MTDESSTIVVATATADDSTIPPVNRPVLLLDDDDQHYDASVTLVQHHSLLEHQSTDEADQPPMSFEQFAAINNPAVVTANDQQSAKDKHKKALDAIRESLKYDRIDDDDVGQQSLMFDDAAVNLPTVIDRDDEKEAAIEVKSADESIQQQHSLIPKAEVKKIKEEDEEEEEEEEEESSPVTRRSNRIVCLSHESTTQPIEPQMVETPIVDEQVNVNNDRAPLHEIESEPHPPPPPQVLHQEYGGFESELQQQQPPPPQVLHQEYGGFESELQQQQPPRPPRLHDQTPPPVTTTTIETPSPPVTTTTIEAPSPPPPQPIKDDNNQPKPPKPSQGDETAAALLPISSGTAVIVKGESRHAPVSVASTCATHIANLPAKKADEPMKQKEPPPSVDAPPPANRRRCTLL
jgi:hypothetical protein